MDAGSKVISDFGISEEAPIVKIIRSMSSNGSSYDQIVLAIADRLPTQSGLQRLTHQQSA